MKAFWLVAFLLLPLLGHLYVLRHLWQLLPLGAAGKWTVIGLCLAAFACFFISFLFGSKMPLSVTTFFYEVGNSWIFILLYLVLAFAAIDLLRVAHLFPAALLHHNVKVSIGLALLMSGLFTYGYLNYQHKVRQPLVLTTRKTLAKPLKLVMITDLHLGYHNRRAEFARWVDMINAEHPDLILIGGDIIDISIRPLLEENVAQEFHRFQAPVYACLGNHEYYSGSMVARNFYREAGITLLRDSCATFGNEVCIIGRDDRTNTARQSVKQLMQKADSSKYVILLDHQPFQLEEAEQAGVDFQLSGHTHYGQVWPISWITDAMYEDAFGPLVKGRTQYYVSSGMGIWGAKFRIGTHSEYVVATLQQQKQ